MHFLTVFWKVLFACVPPTEIWNGWACFCVSISVIGLLTAFIGDLASHFGCTVGLKDTVTAVVFVALGTSIPGEQTSPLREWEHFALQTYLLTCAVFAYKIKTLRERTNLWVELREASSHLLLSLSHSRHLC